MKMQTPVQKIFVSTLCLTLLWFIMPTIAQAQTPDTEATATPAPTSEPTAAPKLKGKSAYHQNNGKKNKPTLEPTAETPSATTNEPALAPPTPVPADDLTSESAPEIIDGPTPEPTTEPVSETMNEPTPAPIDDLTTESANEPTPEPVAEMTTEPTEAVTPEPVAEPSSETTHGATPESGDESTSEPIETPVAELDDNVAGEENIIEVLGTISGKIVYQGRPDYAGIEVMRVGAVGEGLPLDSRGQFNAAVLAVGSYEIRADADLYLPTCATVTISNGQSLSLMPGVLFGGDTNDDDAIKINDATLIGGNFGLSATSTPPINPRADINADGQVNIKDLAIFGGNFGRKGCQTWAQGSAIGEDATTSPSS